MTGIRPFVADNRNLLLLQPISEEASDEGFLRSLAYALRRALQIEYQIEEREVEVELIGRRRMRIYYFGRRRRAALVSGNASSLNRATSDNWLFARSKSFTLMRLVVRHYQIGTSGAQ
jgi:hypothetical protein